MGSISVFVSVSNFPFPRVLGFGVKGVGLGNQRVNPRTIESFPCLLMSSSVSPSESLLHLPSAMEAVHWLLCLRRTANLPRNHYYEISYE